MGKTEGPRSGSGLKCTLYLSLRDVKTNAWVMGLEFEGVEEGEPSGTVDWMKTGVVSKRVPA